MSRIQRDCRLPSMERALLITPDAPMASFPIPTDLIQIRDVLVPSSWGTMRPLSKLSYRALGMKNPLDCCQWYAREQTMIYVAGNLGIGEQLQFLYYGNFSSFATADSDNELTSSTPDFAVYAGLAYAGDHFEHPNADRWEARYQSIKAEVIQMAVDLEAEGGPQSVQPIYHMDDD
jgi:hypothetical protein